MSKANRKLRKARKAMLTPLAGTTQREVGEMRSVVANDTQPTMRPTPERLARGSWHTTKDGQCDMASDLIGRLGVEGKLTGQQVEAARTFQEIHAAYNAELGTVGYRSCLAGGSGGYDNGDGNPEAVRAYNRMANHVGPKHLWLLRQDCAKGPDDRSWSIEGLRAALDAMGE